MIFKHTANPCQNNGTCSDLMNEYQCDCVLGFNETQIVKSVIYKIVSNSRFWRKKLHKCKVTKYFVISDTCILRFSL